MKLVLLLALCSLSYGLSVVEQHFDFTSGSYAPWVVYGTGRCGAGVQSGVRVGLPWVWQPTTANCDEWGMGYNGNTVPSHPSNRCGFVLVKEWGWGAAVSPVVTLAGDIDERQWTLESDYYMETTQYTYDNYFNQLHFNSGCCFNRVRADLYLSTFTGYGSSDSYTPIVEVLAPAVVGYTAWQNYCKDISHLMKGGPYRLAFRFSTWYDDAGAFVNFVTLTMDDAFCLEHYEIVQKAIQAGINAETVPVRNTKCTALSNLFTTNALYSEPSGTDIVGRSAIYANCQAETPKFSNCIVKMSYDISATMTHQQRINNTIFGAFSPYWWCSGIATFTIIVRNSAHTLCLATYSETDFLSVDMTNPKAPLYANFTTIYDYMGFFKTYSDCLANLGCAP